MLDNIKEILQNIGDFFSMVGEWFVDTIEDLVFFINNLSTSVTQVTEIIDDIFPASLVTGFVALLTVVIVLRILGRD